MVLKTTRWSPDTCQCIVEYSWDDAQSEDVRTHSLSNIVQRCSAHTALSTNQTVYNTVIEENPRKNKTWNEILENAPSSWVDIDAETGTKTFKKGITINWEWSGTAPNRFLTIKYYGVTLTQTQLNAIQAKIDAKVGAGKVLLVAG